MTILFMWLMLAVGSAEVPPAVESWRAYCESLAPGAHLEWSRGATTLNGTPVPDVRGVCYAPAAPAPPVAPTGAKRPV